MVSRWDAPVRAAVADLSASPRGVHLPGAPADRARIGAVLREIDPMGLSGAPADEYDPEAQVIALLRGRATSLADLTTLIAVTFDVSFGLPPRHPGLYAAAGLRLWP